jgi:pimeloyl-ACP methyl ester carboxylesterase
MQRKVFETSDGTQMSYISAGEGKPIVMLHGWSQSAEQFKYQIPAFAEHYQVIAVDFFDMVSQKKYLSVIEFLAYPKTFRN